MGMTNYTDEQWSIIQSSIATGAYLGWRRYRRFFSISDARQEATEWVLRHPRQVTQLLEDGHRGQRRLQGRIIGAVTKAGRVEKAHRSGYHPDDEVFYSLPTIELVLPVIWDEEYRPWKPEDEAGRVKTSANRAYMEWETMVFDIRTAWQRADLTVEERGILAARFGDGQMLTTIGAMYGVSEGTIRNRIKGALRALQHELGGPQPKGCEQGCLDCNHVGSRRSVSNAEARAITSGQYDD